MFYLFWRDPNKVRGESDQKEEKEKSDIFKKYENKECPEQ